MLETTELERLAVAVSDHLMQAHRGAVGCGRGSTVIVFGNDGGLADPKGRASIANARAVLTADGFRVGPVAADPDGYTWLFEAAPPWLMPPADALDRAETAVWEGWAAARNLDPDRDGFAHLQRGIAGSATCGVDLLDLCGHAPTD